MINWVDEFKKNNISFSWNELKVGRFGYTDNEYSLKGIVNDKFVLKYTLDYLSKNEDEKNSYLWELGSLFSPYDESEIHKLLNFIANSDENDLKAYYKWRWILVDRLLERISGKDDVNALLEISEFWLDLHSPQDMPYQYQGIENQLTPQEFYTENHLAQVVRDHNQWLEKEKIKIE